MIVKLQVPLETNTPIPQALIYNQDRSVHFQVPMSDEIEALMDKKIKKYFYAELNGESLDISGEAPAQSW